MNGTSKRILGMALAAIAVLGTAGAALAGAGPAARPPHALDEGAALHLAGAEPDLARAAPANRARARRHELRACVKPKVDAGADPKTALRECADQLGTRPGAAGKLGRPGRGGGPGPAAALGRAAHAELVVPKKGAGGQWETIQVDRGRVTAVATDSISLQRPDGPTVTAKVAAGTRLEGAGEVTDLAVGREVVVVSAGGEARSIVARR